MAGLQFIYLKMFKLGGGVGLKKKMFKSLILIILFFKFCTSLDTITTVEMA